MLRYALSWGISPLPAMHKLNSRMNTMEWGETDVCLLLELLLVIKVVFLSKQSMVSFVLWIELHNLFLFYTTSTCVEAHPGFFLLRGMRLRLWSFVVS